MKFWVSALERDMMPATSQFWREKKRFLLLCWAGVEKKQGRWVFWGSLFGFSPGREPLLGIWDFTLSGGHNFWPCCLMSSVMGSLTAFLAGQSASPKLPLEIRQLFLLADSPSAAQAACVWLRIRNQVFNVVVSSQVSRSRNQTWSIIYRFSRQEQTWAQWGLW